MLPKFLLTAVILFSLFTIVGCGSEEWQLFRELTSLTSPEIATTTAFVEWANLNQIPYKDLTVNAISNDQTFARLRVTVKLRPNVQSDWVEMWTEVNCTKVGQQWQVPRYFSFVPVPTPTPKTTPVTPTLVRTSTIPPTVAPIAVLPTSVPTAVVPPTAKPSTTPAATEMPPTFVPTTASSQPTLFFEDDFAATTLNASRWTLDNAVGNSVSVSGSMLRLSSSSNRSPYIYTQTNPFPNTGDFRFSIRYRYSRIGDCGATISLTSAFLPPFTQGQEPIGMPNEGAYKIRFFIWHEVIWYETQSGRETAPLSGNYTSPHEITITYQNNRYRVLQDGTLVFTSNTTLGRIGYIAFGNAAIQANPCSWDSLEIDSVRVERLP